MPGLLSGHAGATEHPCSFLEFIWHYISKLCDIQKKKSTSLTKLTATSQKSRAGMSSKEIEAVHILELFR